MEIALHPSPSPHLVNASSSISSHASSSLPDLDHSDFLAIDDLLDFSNEDIGAPINDSCLSNATSSASPVLSDNSHDAVIATPQLLDKKAFLHHPTPVNVFSSDELCVPCDELAELEWLSNFVEESFSSGPGNLALGGSTANSGFPAEEAGQLRGLNSNDSFHSTSPISVLESSIYNNNNNNNRRGKVGPPSSANFGPAELSVPGRARTKRSRTAVCFWNTRILSPEASESILESSSTATYYDHDESGMFNAYYDNDNDDEDDDEDEYAAGMDRRRYYYNQYQQQKNKPKKVSSSKPKKVSSKSSGNSSSDGANNNTTTARPKKAKVQDANAPVRKCLHCATQKTPQWRAGPMGPKTLCNACGVRYKSGRLCPEYRPAASPTFVESIHSNSHRKVLEMRRMKGEVTLTVSSPLGVGTLHQTSNDQQQELQHHHQLDQQEEQQSKMYACSTDATDSASGADGSGIESGGLSAEE